MEKSSIFKLKCLQQRKQCNFKFVYFYAVSKTKKNGAPKIQRKRLNKDNLISMLVLSLLKMESTFSILKLLFFSVIFSLSLLHLLKLKIKNSLQNKNGSRLVLWTIQKEGSFGHFYYKFESTPNVKWHVKLNALLDLCI